MVFNRQRGKGRSVRWGVPEWYPNEYATSREYPSSSCPVTIDTEKHSVRCAQCGFPIKDRRRHETCPHCGSDNIEGKQLL